MINSLSPEQEKQLPIFREEMRAKGLRLQWASDKEMRNAVRGLYRGAGLKAPNVLVFDSPAACLIARGIMMNSDAKRQLWGQLDGQLWGQLDGQLSGQLWGQLDGQLRGRLWGQLWGQLSGQLRGQLDGQLWGQLWGQLSGQLWGQLWGQLRGQLSGQLRGQLWGQLWDQIWHQLRNQLGDQLVGQLREQLVDQLVEQLGEQFGDQLEEQLEEQLRGQIYETTWFAGGSEVYWVAFCKFCEQIGCILNNSDWLLSWDKYSETCGALYPYKEIAFVSRRPTKLHFNQQRVLHCENGPAMAFGDGFSIHAWNGTRVPSHWIEAPEKVDPTEILKTENVEQRAAGVAIVGMERMLDKLDHKVIDSDENPEHGDLIEVKLPDLPRPGVYLRAYCPRNGRIMEAVNPAEMDEMSVKAAQAWRLGIPTPEFTYPERRT